MTGGTEGLVALPVGQFLPPGGLPLFDVETEAAYFGWPRRFRDRLRVESSDRSYVGQATQIDVSNDVGSAKLTITPVDGGVEVHRELSTVVEVVDAELADQLLELRQALQEMNRVTLLLE